jgi:polyferredoxin
MRNGHLFGEGGTFEGKATPPMQSNRPSRVLLLLAVLIAGLAWFAAAMLWLRPGERAFAISVFGLGLSMGPCLAAYALVPEARKQAARRVVLFTGGLSIMAFSLLGAVNLDLEGFFMLLFAGTLGIAVGHTLVTVILGPLLFGRLLCGWGCWRGMVLELLPIRHSRGRRQGGWRLLPLAGLAASIGGAALSFFVLGHHPGGTPGSVHSASVGAIAVGFGIYYAVSIGMACALHDQRAFCKYLCPSAVILRLTSRLSLLKMSTSRQLCNACGACSNTCPMDIDVVHFAATGSSISTGACILCQRCAHDCPTGAIRLRFGAGSPRERLPFVS